MYFHCKPLISYSVRELGIAVFVSHCYGPAHRLFVTLLGVPCWVVKNCWVYPVGWSIYGGRVEVEEGQEGSIETIEVVGPR